MKASEAKFLDLIKKSSQFVIPIYQRKYSWTAKECRQLWDDILRAGSDNAVSVHFVGSIVYIESGLSQVTSQSPLLVIDGQQRLTSVTLLLAAIAQTIGETEPLDGFSKRKLRNYYLVNPEETGERHHKLLLSQTDKGTLTAIVDDAEQPKDASTRVAENYRLFVELLKSEKDMATVCRGLAKLVVVDLALSREHDNPQLIFESMNSTGRELSQADLIRNFVLMGLEPTRQTLLYEKYWHPIETDFGHDAYGLYFDGFMRHYLTVQTGEIPNVGDVYEAFKAHARSPHVEKAGVESLAKEIRSFAHYYCAFALGVETDPDLGNAFKDLRDLKVEVAYPFLLELYRDYAAGALSKDDFLGIVRLVEAYVFRRAVCAIPTNSMNKTFAHFTKSLKTDRYVESIEAHFMGLPSYRRFPSDDEFRRQIKERDLYNFRSRVFWLRRLENHGRKERVPVDEYTIEHILPQNPDPPQAWKDALGPDWKRVQQTWLHTLGNLTLTGYNSEYRDHPFPEKRDMKGGFKESPLRLNKALGHLESWNEAAIQERAERLATLAVEVWSSPKLSPEVLAAYRPKSEAAGVVYSISDHPFLATGAMKDLFQTFRTEVIALDPCISEEFLKLYVAYKAETNFVDVIPQAKRLILTLNLPFKEIQDPKGLCKDVTGRGQWGNGDVRVELTTADQLPYVLGLVRQSFERQAGDGADA